MEIYINIENLIMDIGSKFMMELPSTDPVPPRGTVVQSINEANARLKAVIGRYLELAPYQEGADDSLGHSDLMTYNLVLSTRKGSGKARPLADLFHSYLVNSALTKILSSMGQDELSGKHDAQAVSDATAINKLLKSKIPPVR